MKHLIAVVFLGLASTGAVAHSIADDIAKFNVIYLNKDPNTVEAKEAKASIERARAAYYHSDTVQLLRVRELLNDGFKAVGAQPAALGSEIQRLEQAITNAQNVDAAKLESAKKLLKQAKAEKAAYDVLHDSVGEQLKHAMKLIEAAK